MFTTRMATRRITRSLTLLANLQARIGQTTKGNQVPRKAKSKARPKSKKDACYHKVKRSYKVFPSAYASGAIAKCRKKGAGRKK